MNIKCRICKTENIKGEHYCKICGNNLSNVIEKTDIIFFISSVFKVLLILWFIFGGCFYLFCYIISNLDGTGTWDIFDSFVNAYFVNMAIFLAFSIVFKQIGIKLSKKNLEKTRQLSV